MKACCRASRCASSCPSTRSPGCPGLPRAASIRAPALPTSTARRRAPARRSPTRRRSIRRTRRRPPSSPANSSAGWANRTQARHGSRISPSSARIRPSSCRSPTTRCTIRRTARLSAARRRLAGGSAQSHPYLAYELAPAEAEKFPARRRRARCATGARTSSGRSARIYYGMISEVDAQLGRIWQAVKASGAWDDTIVILTSDHAEMMGDHFMLGKGGFFDGSYHIPLIVRDPRRGKHGRHAPSTASPRPSTSCRRCSTCSATSCRPHLDGRSLKPFLDGEAAGGLARRGALGVRFPLDRRRHGRTAFRHRLAPVQSGRHPRRRHSNTCISAAACRRCSSTSTKIRARLRNVADDPAYRCRHGSKWPSGCSPGVPSISTSRWRLPS